MNASIRILVFLGVFLLINSAEAQRILLVESTTKFKNFKYFVGDDIMVKTTPYNQKHDGTIHEITDTSILINFDNEIMLEDIQTVLRTRRGLPFLSIFTRAAGAGYFLLDVVNRTINNDSPIVLQNTVMISAGLVAFSYALVPLHRRPLNKDKNKWRIKVLNMSMDEDVPNPFQQ